MTSLESVLIGLAFVVAVGGIIEAAKGGRGYTILFLGDPKPIVVEERYIMKARR